MLVLGRKDSAVLAVRIDSGIDYPVKWGEH